MKTLVRCTILLLLMLAGAGAQAADDGGGTVIVTFSGSEGSVLGIMEIGPTAADPQKAAGLGIKYEHTDEHYKFDGTYLALTAVFMSGEDWQKFVAMWAKARDAQGKTDAGEYFADSTLLSVGMESNGSITFTMAANPDANNVPKDMYVFFLQPKDFGAFDEGVKKVSAFFAN
ncbi:MAG: hypothetical protein KGM97_04530 [Alphaproteobacteria bacterium]|nr:hypothetical protein [Alphaproteobacteria bacterium]MDE2630240.1 hypothetical protein [Alphaproteobacteria bacterium]